MKSISLFDHSLSVRPLSSVQIGNCPFHEFLMAVNERPCLGRIRRRPSHTTPPSPPSSLSSSSSFSSSSWKGDHARVAAAGYLRLDLRSTWEKKEIEFAIPRLCPPCTMVENGKKHRQNSHLINHCPTSEGVSEVSKRANE